MYTDVTQPQNTANKLHNHKHFHHRSLSFSLSLSNGPTFPDISSTNESSLVMGDYNQSSTAHLTLNMNTRSESGKAKTANLPQGFCDNAAHYMISSVVIRPYLSTPSCKQFKQDSMNNRQNKENLACRSWAFKSLQTGREHQTKPAAMKTLARNMWSCTNSKQSRLIGSSGKVWQANESLLQLCLCICSLFLFVFPLLCSVTTPFSSLWLQIGVQIRLQNPKKNYWMSRVLFPALEQDVRAGRTN